LFAGAVKALQVVAADRTTNVVAKRENIMAKMEVNESLVLAV